MAKSKEQILIENGFTKRNDVELKRYGINKECFYRGIGNYELFMNYNSDILYIKIENKLYAQLVTLQMINEENIIEKVIKAVEEDYNNSVNA